jgi:signal recognition particle GTPase
MTDNEIVKCLEICTSEGTKCGNCPYFCDGCVEDGYRSKPMRDALDLIKRQKAEIERLQNHIKNTFENLTKQCVEHEIKTVKSEAYRELAEKLKENTLEVDVSYGYGKEHYTEVVAVVEIDNTLKELTEK